MSHSRYTLLTDTGEAPPRYKPPLIIKRDFFAQRVPGTYSPVSQTIWTRIPPLSLLGM